jgi:hypothetical protein
MLRFPKIAVWMPAEQAKRMKNWRVISPFYLVENGKSCNFVVDLQNNRTK